MLPYQSDTSFNPTRDLRLTIKTQVDLTTKFLRRKTLNLTQVCGISLSPGEQTKKMRSHKN